ncbi:MAG: hypothetical protein EOP07_07715 [Proteobacteria bacterium]|nr:MAG: hypothetical protein EOP07_07715 [Pseudomonadota bacterium]
MKWQIKLFILWFACITACKDQGKVVSEDALVAEANPADGDFLSVLLFPATATVSAGRVVSFEAVGILPYDQSSNISSRGVWTISNPSILVPHEDGSFGKFRAKLPGTTEVIFTLGSITATGTVTVTNKLLQILKLSMDSVAIRVEGIQSSYVPVEQIVEAYGIYSDGSIEDLTADANWVSEDSSRFESKGSGLFRATQPTTTRLSAQVNEITSSIPVDVLSIDRHFTGFSLEPSPLILPMNTDMPLMLRANYSNGESIDVTATAQITTANPALTLINRAGTPTIRGLGIGLDTFNVTYEGHNQSYPLRAVEAQTLSLSVASPSKNFIFSKGDKEHFNATLNYSDGSTANVTSLSTWSSDDITVFTKTGTGADFGYFAATTPGVAKLKTTFGAMNTVSPILVNSASIASIQITSVATGTIGQYTSRTYTAKAIYTDGSSRTLTSTLANWFYIRGGVRTAFASKGFLDATATTSQGPLTIEVVSGDGLGQLVVTVGPPTPVSIDITIPPQQDDVYIVQCLTVSVQCPVAGPLYLVANVRYSDNSVVNRTAASTFEYDILTAPFSFAGFVRDDGIYKAQSTPLAAGFFQVTATYQGVVGSKIVKVLP